MCYKLSMCCLCLNNQTENFHQLSAYYEKINNAIPKLLIKNTYEGYMVCMKCCETIDFVYEFSNKCISNLNTFMSYKVPHNERHEHNRNNTILKETDMLQNEPKYNDDTQRNSEPICETSTLNMVDMASNIKTETTYSDEKIIQPQFLTVYLNEGGSSLDVVHSSLTGQDISVPKLDNEKTDENNIRLHSPIIKVEEVDTDAPICENFMLNDNHCKTEDIDIIMEEVDIKIEESDIKTTNINEDENNKHNESKESYIIQHVASTHVSQQMSDDDTDNYLNYEHQISASNKNSEKTPLSNDVGCTSKHPHTHEKIYKCNVCNKRFKTSSDLTKHKSTHTEEKPYICDVCNKGFKLSGNLSTHKFIHTGEKPHKCEECSKCFTKSGDLTRHKLIHTGENSYVCDICNKRFRQSGYLAKHKRIHTGVKPYKCDVCNKAFITRSDLSKHYVTHTGVKPYKCDVCNRGFTQSFNLTRHKRNHTIALQV